MSKEQGLDAFSTVHLPEGFKRDLAEITFTLVKPYLTQLKENLDRLKALAELYVILRIDPHYQTSPALGDMLRAVVVLTHATFEDFLRTLAARLLPEAEEKVLNEIPLEGLNASGRAEKFPLGKLIPFKGKSVDDVITDSIKGYLQRKTFNRIEDITELLKSLGLEISQVSGCFPQLATLMERRHMIVHRGDKLGESDPTLREIDCAVVLEWMQAVTKFIEDVLPGVAWAHLTTKGQFQQMLELTRKHKIELQNALSE